MSVTLISAGRFKFHGRWVLRGEVFEASEMEASELCAPSIRYATRAPAGVVAPAPPPPPEYERADLRAVEPLVTSVEAVPDRAKKKRRRYARRDLRARR